MNLRYIVLCFFLCFTTSFWCQTDVIPTDFSIQILRKQLEELQDSEVEQITSLSNHLYKASFEGNDINNMIYALQKLSHTSLNLGNNTMAIEYIDRAIAIAQEHRSDQKTIVDLIKLKGNHFFDIEEYDQATTAYFEALEIAKTIDYPYALWALSANLGFVKLRSGETDGALKDLKKSLINIPKIAKEGSFLFHRSEMLINARICEAYIKKGKLDSALFCNNKGLKISTLIRLDNAHIDLLMHRGILFKEKGNYVLAIKFLEEAKELACKVNDNVFSGKILNLIAACNYELGEYKTSIEILHEALAILGKNYRNSDELSKCYKLLGQSYKKVGDLQKSNDYYEKHILSLTRLNRKKSSASRKVRDATFDNYEEVIQNLETDLKKDQNWLKYSKVGMILFGIGIISVVVFLNKTKLQNKRKFDTLLAKIETHEQQNLASKKPDTNTLVINSESKRKVVDKSAIETDISKDLCEQILKGLEQIESKQYFLKKECNLYNVAKKIRTNTSYLSKVINSHFGKNFNTYINDLRINYSILRLKNDAKFRSFSIKSIAEEVGYKSADSFSKYFKAHTGLLPSFYIKRLNSQQKKVS